MKNTKKIFIIIMLIVLSIGLFSCNKKQFAISFVSFGEEIASVKHKGTANVDVITPEKEGYRFLGWFLDNDIWEQPFDSFYFANSKIDKNYTVYAKWQKIEYITVKFVTFSEEIADILVEKGKSTTLPVPTQSGQQFLCWCNDANLNSAVTEQTIFYQDTTVFAKWLSSTTSGHLNITIIVPDQQPIVLSIAYGKKVSMPELVVLGKKLGGIYTDSGFTQKYDQDMLVTTSFSLYTFWYEVDSLLTVTFVTDKGGPVPALQVLYNELISFKNLTTEGYLLVGWYTDSKFVNKFDFSKDRITQNITLYAKWQKDDIPKDDYDYIIYYFDENGMQIFSQECNIGSEPSLYAGIVGSDYIWCIDADLTTLYEYDASNTSDIYLYIKYIDSVAKGDFLVVETTNGWRIEKYNGTAENLTIPQQIDNKSVVQIGASAFYFNQDIKKITLPPTITYIGEQAFRYCDNLAEINLIHVTYIGSNAFESSGITSVFTEKDLVMGEAVFKNCGKLTTVEMSQTTTIMQNTFENCKNLTTVRIYSCTTIKVSAFKDCKKLSDLIINSCKEIGYEAFSGCTALQSVNIDKCENINGYAFEKTGLLSVSMPQVRVIGSFAFASCNNLVEVFIGEHIVSIDEEDILYSDIFNSSFRVNITVDVSNEYLASQDGSLLTKDKKMLLAVGGITVEHGYSIPNGVENIAMFAFTSGMTIRHLSIPSSVISLDMSLSQIKDLEQITLIGENENFYIDSEYGNLYSKDHVLVRYLPQLENEEFAISDFTTGVLAGAFSHCANLKTVIINDNLTTIDFGAFYDCTSLVEVKNTSHITIYQDFCFYGCENLTDIEFGENIIEIGEDSFGETNIVPPFISALPED